jgi:hypothetical protein
MENFETAGKSPLWHKKERRQNLRSFFVFSRLLYHIVYFVAVGADNFLPLWMNHQIHMYRRNFRMYFTPVYPSFPNTL